MLNAVQSLIEHNEADESGLVEREPTEQHEAAETMAPLHLIGVVSGSACYRVAASDSEQAINTLSETGLSLLNPDSVEWGPELLSPIEELSSIARSLS